jgi:gliding motility-associated-like protein
LVLTITESTSNTTTVSECDSYTWSVNGTTYTQSGTYTVVNGCATEILDLTITESTSNTTTASSCDNYTWAVNGTTYTQSGTYTSVNGCATEILVLTITESTSNTTTVSECDSYTWAVNGTTYTQSGTYTSVNGCATEILVLNILESGTNTTTESACDSYTWSVNGTTYTSSGTYTVVTGCSTEILNLTITESTSNTTTVSECDSYTWAVNGTTYTTSGTYTFVTGCSTEILVLTITESTSNTTTASSCDSYTWSVNGTTYTQSGTYSVVNGCATEILVLTILESTTNTSTVSACDSFTWSVNGTSYTASGTYTEVVGCVTEVLNLTISSSSSIVSYAGPDQFVCGTSATLAAIGTGTWTVPQGIDLSGPNEATSVANAVTYGTYQLFWTVNAGSCVAVDTVAITFNQPNDAAFYFAANALCANATPPTPWVAQQGGTFSASPSGLIIDAATGALLPEGSLPGTYTIYHSIAGICPALDSAVVTLLPLPAVSFTTIPAVCAGSAPIDLGAFATPAGGTWSGTQVADNAFDPASVGTTALNYTYSDGTCTNMITTNVTVTAAPVAHAGPDLSSCTDQIVLQAVPAQGVGTWSFTSLLNLNTVNAAGATATSTTPGSHELVWTVNDGVCTAADTVHITFLDPGTSVWVNAGEDQVLELAPATTLEGEASPGATLTWSVIEGSASLYDASQPVAYITDLLPGNYTVMLTASLSECFSLSDTLQITVLDLFIPEGFSPNDDGVNDTFRITGLAAYPGANLQIYDRWGLMVHENTDYANEWKGTGRNGHDLPDDTYFYVLNLPERGTYKGHLIIKR